MGESVELSKIAAAIEQDEPTTRGIISDMMTAYEKQNRGIRIIELDHSFQLCTKKEYYDYLIRIARQPKRYVLTDVMLETLSIIAYRQPVTKLEIEKIRGVKSDHAVNKLVEYGLVEEVGRMDAPGRPILFGTTEEFLRRFSVQSLLDPVADHFFKFFLKIFTDDKYHFIKSGFHRIVNRIIHNDLTIRAYRCKLLDTSAKPASHSRSHDYQSCLTHLLVSSLSFLTLPNHP